MKRKNKINNFKQKDINIILKKLLIFINKIINNNNINFNFNEK